MINNHRSRHVSSLKSTLGITVLVALTVTLVLCSQRPKPVTGPSPVPLKQSKDTAAAYKAGGWVPLQEPDSRFVPGTIFEATPNQWPHWVSSLESCGVPKDVLNAASNNTGSFKYSGDATYGAKAVLAIKGVTAGPDFSAAQAATFVQSDAGASAIDIIRLGEWLHQNPTKFSQLCREYLSKPNRFVAQESYRVGNGTYTLKDSSNATLSLKGLQIKILNLSADANAKITADSSLTLTVPVYTAVHQAVYADDMLDLINGTFSRGVEGLKYADEAINKDVPQ